MYGLDDWRFGNNYRILQYAAYYIFLQVVELINKKNPRPPLQDP
jgi:hypothetical protein